MYWKKLKGTAKEYFDYYRQLEWIKDHHLDALARGCVAAAKLDEIGSDYEVTRFDKNGQTERKTPEAMEVNKLRLEVDNMNKTFGLTPYDQGKIQKVEPKSAKEKRITKVPLRKVKNE
jgi:hypothetical protein